MSCSTTVRNTFVLLLLLGVAGPSVAQEAEEPSPQEVWFGEDVAVTYAARLEGDWLVVEARHEPGWHTASCPRTASAARRCRGPGGERVGAADRPVGATAGARRSRDECRRSGDAGGAARTAVVARLRHAVDAGAGHPLSHASGTWLDRREANGRNRPR